MKPNQLNSKLINGDVILNFRIPKDFNYRVAKMASIELKIESEFSEQNIASKFSGATVSTSSGQATTIDNNGNLSPDNHSIDWIVADFHQDSLIKKILLTRTESNSSLTEEILFEVKIWGGSLFFTGSPRIKGSFKNSKNSYIIFAEQRTDKILVEFGKFDAAGNITAFTPISLANINILAASFPANLRLRIGDQPPFFEHRGDLVPGITIGLPDFSAEINQFLAENTPEIEGDKFLIPLIIHSDSHGKLLLSSAKETEAATALVLEPDSDRVLRERVDDILQEQDFGNKLEIRNWGFSLEGEVNSFFGSENDADAIQEKDLEFDGKTDQKIFLEFPSTNSSFGVEIMAASLDLKGSLSKEILLIAGKAVSSRVGQLGSKGFLLAQFFKLADETDISAIDLELEFITGRVEFSAGIHPDFNQQPSDDPLPGAIAALQFPMAQIEKTGSPALVKFDLPEKTTIPAGNYWVVLSVTDGELIWRLNDEQAGAGELLFTRLDGAVKWTPRTHPQTEGPVAGVFAVHSIPRDAADLIAVKIGSQPGTTVQDIDNPAEIDVKFEFVQLINEEENSLFASLSDSPFRVRIPITLSAQATGTLQLSNLIMKFREDWIK